MKTFYERGGIKIIHGDAVESAATLPANHFAGVLTDPPFSSGTRREAAKGLRKSMNRACEEEDWFTTDCLTTNGFVWLMRSCAVTWKRILIPGAHVLSFIDWRMESSLMAAIESADFRIYGSIIWNKTYFGMGRYFRKQHERIVHLTNGRPQSEALRHDIGDVIDCKPLRGGLHETEKPVELLAKIGGVVFKSGDTILDPFCGSGPTLAAAVVLGISAVGIDNMESNCEIAAKRIDAILEKL